MQNNVTQTLHIPNDGSFPDTEPSHQR